MTADSPDHQLMLDPPAGPLAPRRLHKQKQPSIEANGPGKALPH